MKLDWLVFWIAALATYRLTVAVSRDLIFKWLRNNYYIGKWAKCPFCVSPYMSTLVCAGLYLSGVSEPWPIWICLCLSLSAITIAADRVFTSDYIN